MQYTVLSPFSMLLPQPVPSAVHRRDQASLQTGMFAKVAMDRTIPNAPADEVATRRKTCWYLAKGRRQRTMPMEVRIDTRTMRALSDGCIMTVHATPKVELHVAQGIEQQQSGLSITLTIRRYPRRRGQHTSTFLQETCSIARTVAMSRGRPSERVRQMW